MVSNCAMFLKARAICKFCTPFSIDNLYCRCFLIDFFFDRCFYIDFFFDRCFYIDVFSSMFLHRCFFIDVVSIGGLLLEIDLVFYHRCFTIDVSLLIIDFMSMFRCRYFTVGVLRRCMALVSSPYTTLAGWVYTGTRLVLRIS